MKKLNLVLILLVILTLGYKLDIVKAYTAPPCLESEVMVDTGNGFGSGNTKVRRFANVDINVGSDITYADSATDGASFTINTNGIYTISYTDYRGDSGDSAGVAVNSSTLGSLSGNSNVFCVFSPNPTNIHNCSVTVILSSGDVISAVWSTAGFSDSQATTRLLITKIR
jgi:hypothetical protein